MMLAFNPVLIDLTTDVHDVSLVEGELSGGQEQKGHCTITPASLSTVI